jgi:ribosomal protein S5
MKNQEAYQDITRWENSISSLKTNLKEESTQKDKEKTKACTSGVCHTSRVCKTVLKSKVLKGLVVVIVGLSASLF